MIPSEITAKLTECDKYLLFDEPRDEYGQHRLSEDAPDDIKKKYEEVVQFKKKWREAGLK